MKLGKVDVIKVDLKRGVIWVRATDLDGKTPVAQCHALTDYTRSMLVIVSQDLLARGMGMDSWIPADDYVLDE